MAQSTPKMFMSLVIALALGLAALSPAFALETTKVGGDVDQSVDVRGAITTVAIGAGASAGTSMATVHGGANVSGKVSQHVSVRGAVTTVAIGAKSSACTLLASVGSNPSCK